MPIQVTCPGCMQRFAVSDKYAGKKGPCPKCKKEIVIPEKQEEVVIHAPEVSGPKDSKGVSVLKPIARSEFKVGKLTWILFAVGLLIVLGVAIGVRMSDSPAPTPLLAFGAILLAPPIVMAGYTFLRDDGLAGYEGQEYWIRVAICSAAFAATWLIYFGLSWYFEHRTLAEISTTEMIIYTVVMIGLGLAASLLTFELEAPQSALHYLAYFVITFALCLVMGVELGEPLSTQDPSTPSGVVPLSSRDAVP